MYSILNEIVFFKLFTTLKQTSKQHLKPFIRSLIRSLVSEEICLTFSIISQCAHDVVLTSMRRRFNVMDVVWTSKRRHVLTGIQVLGNGLILINPYLCWSHLQISNSQIQFFSNQWLPKTQISQVGTRRCFDVHTTSF